jgi:predicted nucleic acid-binding protein
MARYLIDADLRAEITGLTYDLLKRYAKPDGLRTFDALIAATTIAENFTLVSRNRKHYRMISVLSFESPDY